MVSNNRQTSQSVLVSNIEFRSINAFINGAVYSSKPSKGDDVIGFKELEDQSLLVMLADGATGVGFGKFAAEYTINRLSSSIHCFSDFCEIASLIHEIDTDIKLKYQNYYTSSTIIALIVDSSWSRIAYVCIGDSYLFEVNKESIIELSKDQEKRPLVGDKCKLTVMHEKTIDTNSRFVLCSDGLFYLSPTLDLKSFNIFDIEVLIERKIAIDGNIELSDDLSFLVLSNRLKI